MEPEIVLQSYCLGGAPPSRPLARLSSNARVSPRVCGSRPTRARSSPPGASRLFIAASCAPRRDDDVSPRPADPHAGFGAAVAPQLPRARPRAPRAPSRPHHARARAGNQDEEVRPTPRASVPARPFFFFSGCLPPSRDRARGYPRRAAPSLRLFPSLTPSPSAIPPPVPLARGEALPGLRVAPRRHVRVSPPLRRRVIRPVPSPRLRRRGSSPPPSSSAAPHRHPPRRRSSPPSAPRRFRVRRQVLVQRFDTSRNGCGGVLRGVGDVFARVVARRASRGRPRASGTIELGLENAAKELNRR